MLWSHLLQMRGLKHLSISSVKIVWVASFTDAWIETREQEVAETTKLSHLLQMRGLKRQSERKTMLFV